MSSFEDLGEPLSISRRILTIFTIVTMGGEGLLAITSGFLTYKY